MQFCNLKQQYTELKDGIDANIAKVLEHGLYIGGPEVTELEKKCAEFVGVKYAKACSSGTDALLLALMAYDVQPGDYIVTTPFTFIATAEVISLVKAVPLFVDIDEKTYNICPDKLKNFLKNPPVDSKKIKGVITVDLYGQSADYDAIRDAMKGHDMFLIQDAAQSFGGAYKGKNLCSQGDIGCTSFFPAKPFGCYGDGGMVFTNDDKLDERLGWLRNHGQNVRYSHKIIGINGRLDTLQAAVMLGKFDRFVDYEIKKRNDVALAYIKGLKSVADKGKITLPYIMPDSRHIWAQFTVLAENRDGLMAHLSSKGIPSAIHYPIPLHLQEAFAEFKGKEGDYPVSEKISKNVMSFPMCAYKTDAEIEEVCAAVAEFYA
ncbi:MAG: DegT/DnrJ/EryC1/StrS family aminotransferase [Deferribacterales bacterium]